MNQITPEVIASWPQPNYAHPHDSRTSSILAAVFTTTVLMLLFVAARVYVRTTQTRRDFGTDDWLMVCAAILGVAVSVLLTVQTKLGLGRHLYDVDPAWMVKSAKTSLAILTLYTGCLTFAKASICVTYLQLFPSRVNKIFSWTMITYQTLLCIITSLLYIFQCLPVSASWDSNITGKKCLSARAVLSINAALNLVSDFTVFLWPVMPLWQIRLSLEKRIYLIVVFSFGVFTCIAGLLKVIWVQDYFSSWDTTWVSTRVVITLIVEYNIGIISGCLPVIKPLLAMIFPNFFDKSSADRSEYPHGSVSWRKTPFESKAICSVQLDSQANSEHALGNTKMTGGAKSWFVGGGENDLDSDVEMNGIKALKDISIHNAYPPTGQPRADASSEEWIIQRHDGDAGR